MSRVRVKNTNPEPVEADADDLFPTDEPAEEVSGKKKAGAHPHYGTAMDTALYVRCNHEQKEAIEAFVRELSAKREAQGFSKVNVGTWIRELALKHSGNDHLGLAAQARAKAESASSIV